METKEDVKPNFKIVHIKSEAEFNDDVPIPRSPEKASGSSSPTIVIKQDESPGTQMPGRQGFIEVNGSSTGMTHFTLKSGASLQVKPLRMFYLIPVAIRGFIW